MKKNDKLKDLAKLEKSGLETLLAEKKEKLRQFKFDLVSGKVKNIREIRETKKDVARILTNLAKNQKI